MKKFKFFIIVVLLCLCGCQKRNKSFFDLETLEKYGLGDNFPKYNNVYDRDDNIIYLKKSLFSDYTLSNYTSDIYHYLLENKYYVGTYETYDLVVQMFPLYAFKGIDDPFFFMKDKITITYLASDSIKKNENNLFYYITIEEVLNEEYNTKIILGEKELLYKEKRP